MLDHSDDPRCPAEYRSVEEFVEYIEDDERPYTIKEIVDLAYWLKATTLALGKILKEYGLTAQGQKHEHAVCMATTNQNDRWQACPSHGGGGGDSLIGIAGRAG